MNIIELHRDFSERFPFARAPKKPGEILCGQIDNITFELYPETELFINKD